MGERFVCGYKTACKGAIRSLVPIAFERFDIVRFEAGIFSNNPASMRLLEKCGFTREAVHRMAITKNGVTLDEAVYVHFGGPDFRPSGR